MINLTWTSVTRQRTLYSGYPKITPTTCPETTWSSAVVEHGLKDNKGRSIGNFAIIESFQPLVWVTKDGKEQLVEIEGAGGRCEIEAEPAFFVTTQATRNGHTFGAISTHATRCKTLEEAQALAAKKIAAAGKRFARQIAKGEGRQFAPKTA